VLTELLWQQFFFPINYRDHYIVIVANVKNLRFDILDNSKTDVQIEDLYGEIPRNLVRLKN